MGDKVLKNGGVEGESLFQIENRKKNDGSSQEIGTKPTNTYTETKQCSPLIGKGGGVKCNRGNGLGRGFL